MLDIDDLKNDAIFNRPRIRIVPSSLTYTLDIELSNHCNAHCYYCPRELVGQMGYMAESDFKTIIDQVNDYPEKMSVGACGHGESILHPQVAEFVFYAREKNLPFGLHTNGSLLTPEKTKALLNAGLTTLRISVSALGELHEQMYQLKFDPVLKNIKAFIKASQGSCKVEIYIVQTDLNKNLIKDYKTFWEDIGVDRCDVFPVSNRSGSLSGKNIIYTDSKNSNLAENIFHNESFTNQCLVGLVSYFIGYDGNHYLCANDWEKKINMGHVNTISLKDVLISKIQVLHNQTASICNTCDFNIKNRIKDCLRQANNTQALNQLIEVRQHEEKMIRELLADQDNKI